MANELDKILGGDPVSATESSDSVSTGAPQTSELDSILGSPPQVSQLDSILTDVPTDAGDAIPEASQTFEMGIEGFRKVGDFLDDFANLPKTAAIKSFQAVDKLKLVQEMSNLEGFVDPNLEKVFGLETFRELESRNAEARNAQAERIEQLKNRIATGDDIVEELTPEDMTFVGGAARSGIESVISNSPGFAASMWTRNPGPMLAQISAATYGHSAGDALLAGKDVTEAQVKGTIDASIEALTEVIPAKILVSEFGKRILDGAGEVSGPLLRFAIADLTGEQIATIGQSLSDYAFELDPEINEDTPIEEIIEIQKTRQLATAFATIAGGVAQTGTVAGLNKVRNALDKKKDDDTPQEFVGPVIEQELLDARVQQAESAATFDSEIDRILDSPLPTPVTAEVQSEQAAKSVGPTPKISVEQAFGKRIIRSENKWERFDAQAREPGVYITAPQVYQDAQKELKKDIENLKAQHDGNIEGAAAFALQGRHEIALQMRQIADIQRRQLDQTRQELRDTRRKEQNWLVEQQQQAGVLEQWRQAYLPQSTLILDSMHKEQGIDPRGTMAGFYNPMHNGGRIVVNPLLGTEATRLATLAHEFGHSFMGAEFNKLGPKAQRALHLEFQSWQEQVEQGTLRQMLKSRETPDQLAGVLAAQEGKNPPVTNLIGRTRGKSFVEYWMNFAEYGAQQMAKYQAYHPKARKVAEPFFKSVTKKLERFFKKERKHFAPEAGYQAWLEARAADNHLAMVERRLTETRAKAGPTEFSPATMEAYQRNQVNEDVDKWDETHGENQQPLSDLLKKAQVPFDQNMTDSLDGKRDNFSKFKKNFLTLLQIGRRNPHVPGLAKPTQFGGKSYIQLQREMAQARLASDKEIEQVLHDWRKLGSKQAEKVGRLLAEVDTVSFREKRKLPLEEIREKATELGLNEQAWQEYQVINRYLQNQIDQLQEELQARVLRQVEDGDLQSELISEINQDMARLRSRNFFPSSRFGNHVVVVRAKSSGEFEGQAFKKGDVLIREHYELAKDAKTRTEELRKSNIGRKHNVFQDKIEETENMSFRDIPPAALKVLMQGANETQRALIQEALVRAAPGQGFAKHMLKKRGIAGASRDYMKSLLSYNQSLTRHMARIQFDDQMNAAMQAVNQSITEIQNAGGNATKRRMIMEFMQEHKDYIFNPGNELNEWSALAFNWYLAGVPKQAFLNASQIPMVTAPYLTAKYGAKAEVELAKAIKQVWNKKFNPTKLKPELQEALLQGEQEGFLDQSFSHEAAGLQQAGTLRRLLPGNLMGSHRAARALSAVSEVGAYLFHKSEIFTRRIAFVSAWNLEMGRSGDKLRAYQAGREAVQASIFEYAQWNRPRIMTGKKKPFFIFMTHMQHMMDYMFGDNPGKWFVWAMIMYAAGLQGLPFAEDILDAASWFMKLANKARGNVETPPDARLALRTAIHDMVSMVDEDSASVVTDTMLHGAGRYGMGLGWLGERAGVPLPSFDISGSFGLGDIIPGTEALNARNKEQALAQITEGALGPGLAIPIAVVGAAVDTTGDPMKRAAQLAPKAIANPMKALEYYTREEATTKTGIQLAEFDKENPMHQAEMISQALGFPVQRVNLEREKRWMQKQTLNYYQVQRGLISDQFVKALEAENEVEALADARKALKEFNEQVPHPGLRIDGEGLKRSVLGKLKRGILQDKNIPTRQADIPFSREIGSKFEGEQITEEVLPQKR